VGVHNCNIYNKVCEIVLDVWVIVIELIYFLFYIFIELIYFLFILHFITL